MTPDDIVAMVQSEIHKGWDADDPLANPHGIDLARCLLSRPVCRTYLDSFNDNRPMEMWLVLEEDPDGHGAYEVVFDEARREFGLATSGKHRPVFIGYYGSFRETLAGM